MREDSNYSHPESKIDIKYTSIISIENIYITLIDLAVNLTA